MAANYTSTSTSGANAGKPYGCFWCPMHFKRKEHKARHEQSHMPQRSFPCAHCSSSFLRKDVLVRHVRNVHFGNDRNSSDNRAEICRTPRRGSKESREKESPSNPTLLPIAGCHPASLNEIARNSFNGESATHTVFTASDAVERYDGELFESGSNAMIGDELPYDPYDLCPNNNFSVFPYGVSYLGSTFDLSPSSNVMWLSGHETFTPQQVSNDQAEDTVQLMEKIERMAQHSSPMSTSATLEDGGIDRLRQILLDLGVHDQRFNFSKFSLQTYLRNFFRFFHPHLPLFHVPTFDASKCPETLLLCICTIGAFHSFDSRDAHILGEYASLFFETQCLTMSYLTKLQAVLLLATIKSFTGNKQSSDKCLSLQMRLVTEFHQAPVNLRSSTAGTWEEWIEMEGLKRSLCLILTYLAVMHASFSTTPVLIGFDYSMELPYDERYWTADSVTAWQALDTRSNVPPMFKSTFHQLLSEEVTQLPDPGLMALNALVAALYIHISQTRSISLHAPHIVTEQLRERCATALRRWLTMISVFQDNDYVHNGNQTLAVGAVLLCESAFVQLYIDQSSLRGAKVDLLNADDNEQDRLFQPVTRSMEMTMAMYHTITSVRGPLSHGMQFLIRTGCIDLGIFHCLLGFRSIVFLVRWLYTLELASQSGTEESLTSEESEIVENLRSCIHQSNVPSLAGLPLSKACAKLWGDVTGAMNSPWEITYRLGEYLKVFV